MTGAKGFGWLESLAGRIVFCLASGPSLTAEDCELVRASGLPTLVTNTTFRMCPWATALVAADSKWWKMYVAEVDSVFGGQKVKCGGGRHYAQSTQAISKYRSYGNSGTAAISLAVFAGASRVILLGCDAQFSGGKTHWHGDHPAELSNAKTVGNWPAKFENVARYAIRRGVPVLNASRETALACFPRVALEEVLCMSAN